MKNILKAFACILAAVCCLGNMAAIAGHEAGMAADLSYVATSPNTYTVTYRFYRDCSAAVPPAASVPLVFRAPGCQAGDTTLLQQTSIELGQPFCFSGTVCASATGLNYNMITYAGTVTLPALCANWVLSVTNEDRMGDNLVPHVNGSLYSETTLNNMLVQNNSSPIFGSYAAMYSIQNQQNVIFLNMADTDGDSIVYSLSSPLNGYNAPAQFLPGYSASAPLGAGAVFTLDPVYGRITLNSAAPQNSRFAARLTATEYRNINGMQTIIGITNRDLLFVVAVPPPSTPISPFTAGGQPVQPVYEIPALEPACLSFTASTTRAGAPNNRIVITTNSMQTIPLSTHYVTGSDTVKTITICWRPNLEDIRATPYRINLVARNNECPIPQFVSQVVEIRVVKKKVSNSGPVVTIDPNQPAVARQTIPNIITPNSDGLNDAFIIPDLPENAELQIFDRKQKLVKTFKRYQNNWNAEGMKEGVYYFILKNKVTGEVIKGEVTVVR